MVYIVNLTKEYRNENCLGYEQILRAQKRGWCIHTVRNTVESLPNPSSQNNAGSLTPQRRVSGVRHFGWPPTFLRMIKQFILLVKTSTHYLMTGPTQWNRSVYFLFYIFYFICSPVYVSTVALRFSTVLYYY
jgi:hypothetical protein